MTYINAVKYIMSLPDANDTDAVERMRIICDTFDNPQRKLKAIHVCGDVGKDSCITMLESVLNHSPHRFGRCSLSEWDDPRECISVNRKIISHSELADIIKMISTAYRSKFKEAVPRKREVMTLAAMLYFANNGCDVALFERSTQKNDPVSITEPPTVSVLTPFLEREINNGQFEYLIPKGTAETVSSPQHKEIYSLVSNACVLAGSRLTVPIYSDMEIKSITLFKTEFSYRGEAYSVRSFSPCQTVNAITTIEVINSMTRCGFSISEDAIKKGLFSTNLEGKCEAISIEPTVIVSSSYEKDRLDTLIASLAQIKEQFLNDVDVYVNSECPVDLGTLSESLSAHEIRHRSPTLVALETAEELLKNISSLSPDSAIVFIGNKNFISKIKRSLNDRIGF